MEKSKQASSVKTLVKALKILDEVAMRQEPIGVTELSKKMGIDKATIYRLLNTLQNMGYIEQNSDTQKYYLGLKILELSSNILEHNDLRTIAHPYIVELMEKTGETIHLGVLDQNKIVYIDKMESYQTIRMVSKIGSSVDIYCTALGKSILAFMKKDKADEIIKNTIFKKRTDNTIVSPELLKVHLKEISKRGFAIDYEENEKDVICVGAPIFMKGEVMAAISISGPAFRLTNYKILDFGSLVAEYAQKISNDRKLKK